MQEQNFADEIYKIFKAKRKTALKCQDLTEQYKKLYGRTLNTTELRELPFIQFEKTKNGSNYNNNMIYLVVELDDCCNKCKFRYCKLLHSVDQNDKFHLMYPNSTHHPNKLSKIQRPDIRLIQRVKDILNASTSNPKQLTLTEMKRIHNQRFPKYKSHEPSAHGIAIRFKSTFHIGYDEGSGDHLIMYKHDQNHANLNNSYKNQSRYNNGGYHQNNVSSNNYKKSNVIINSKKSHQSPWQKKSKPPHKSQQISLNTNNNHNTHSNGYPHNVSISSTTSTSTTSMVHESNKLSSSSNAINTDNDDQTESKSNPRSHPIKEASIIPEQCNKHYLSITISPEWNDSKLIPDLVRHISQNTGKHVDDAYIDKRVRLGFFTAKNQSIAQSFVRNVQQKKFKCWGRTINADIIPLPKNTGSHGNGIQRQQSGFRVKIQNVNCIMGRKDFEKWVWSVTNTVTKRHLIYDIEIVFPKITRGSSQCIMLFDHPEDTKYVLDKIQNKEFRGFPLRFKPWHHPHFDASMQSKPSKPSKALKPTKPPSINKSHSQKKYE